MISRRKFLRAGALFLPASAMGQIVVPNRRVFVSPACSGTNFTAADFEPWRLNAGCGWIGDGVLSTKTGNAPWFRTGVQADGNKPCINTIGFTWGRKLAIGNNWTQIRLGFLYQSAATAGTFVYNLFFGMINNGKIWGQAGCNFIGMQLGGGGNWTYSANQYVVSASNEIAADTNVNAVNASVQQLLGASNVMTEDSQHRSLSFVELTKGSPNYTVQIYTVRAAGEALQDMNENDLNTGLGAASGADIVVSGRSLKFGSSTIAFSETNGNLDTAALYIDATGSKASNFYAIGVRKIA